VPRKEALGKVKIEYNGKNSLPSASVENARQSINKIKYKNLCRVLLWKTLGKVYKKDTEKFFAERLA